MKMTTSGLPLGWVEATNLWVPQAASRVEARREGQGAVPAVAKGMHPGVRNRTAVPQWRPL